MGCKAQQQTAIDELFVELIPTANDGKWHDFPKYFGVHYKEEQKKRLGQAFYQKLAYLQNH